MNGGNLHIDTVSNPPCAVVLIRGEVDAVTAPELAATVDALPATITTVELDLTAVGFIDSTGIGVMATLLNRLEPIGGRLVVRNPSSLVVRLLTVTDLLRFVELVEGDP